MGMSRGGGSGGTLPLPDVNGAQRRSGRDDAGRGGAPVPAVGIAVPAPIGRAEQEPAGAAAIDGMVVLAQARQRQQEGGSAAATVQHGLDLTAWRRFAICVKRHS